MNFDHFVRQLRSSVPEGTVMPNPGGGTSTIVWSDEARLCYQRGGSRFYVALGELHNAYEAFVGQDVTTRDLKAYSPKIFDSAAGGHNCNATVLFLVLERMGLSSGIWVRGRSGAPFGVSIPSSGHANGIPGA